MHEVLPPAEIRLVSDQLSLLLFLVPNEIIATRLDTVIIDILISIQFLRVNFWREMSCTP